MNTTTSKTKPPKLSPITIQYLKSLPTIKPKYPKYLYNKLQALILKIPNSKLIHNNNKLTLIQIDKQIMKPLLTNNRIILINIITNQPNILIKGNLVKIPC